jgi:hypothetical protein
MSAQEITFWFMIGITIAVEILGGVICWLYLREVDQCHK